MGIPSGKRKQHKETKIARKTASPRLTVGSYQECKLGPISIGLQVSIWICMCPEHSTCVSANAWTGTGSTTIL